MCNQFIKEVLPVSPGRETEALGGEKTFHPGAPTACRLKSQDGLLGWLFAGPEPSLPLCSSALCWPVASRPHAQWEGHSEQVVGITVLGGKQLALCFRSDPRLWWPEQHFTCRLRGLLTLALFLVRPGPSPDA